jgi:single-stranded DNA-binding protein
MLNLTLVGNRGVDPTVGATHKGTPIATLRVAVNHVRTDTTTGERLDVRSGFGCAPWADWSTWRSG